ncbi:MAG: SRPBCC domain-containing protein [Chthonomonadaceae bacterium]|jgi:uncharacterized protein YndB with AHSA1/START domain|nr:SRPBCC domain-containing protein [Chthonomonadaceae bacterium]
MTITDAIERTLELAAPQAKVWDAIATAKGICSWFCQRVIGDWSPGQTVEMAWGEDRVKAKVVASEPMTRFAYRWVPGCANDGLPYEEANTTEVEFTLTPTASGTRLRLVESGFSKLPASHIERCFRDNDQGWDDELPKLAALFA